MGNIHVLKPEISNKIAAGEVVERPASVVKELVENSIDADATKIVVEIKNGGVQLISVSDNGKGMEAEDAQIAFLRHATSKIQSESDLDAIYTLGFRGEALSSIGAVSEALIYTKRSNDEFGTVVSCEGGEIIASEESGMSDGTTVVVRNLFYNTPARMKFLKKDATEAGYISDIMNRFVLSHPEISFKFIKNGKEVLNSPGDGVLKNAVYSVYGRDYANSIIEVDYSMDGVTVNGFIGKSNLVRPNRNFQTFFVNKRSIKSPLIIRALEEAFKNQIMIGKFPVASLNVDINPSLIDINVHPTKLEVKFSDDKRIYDSVYYAVKSALYDIPEKETEAVKHNPRENPFLIKKQSEPEKEPKKQTTEMSSDENKSSVKVVEKIDPLAAFRKTTVSNDRLSSPELDIVITKDKPEGKTESDADIPVARGEQLEMSVSSSAPEEKKVGSITFKVVGQIFDTYIIVEKGSDMLLIDQHAAHERIKYEQLLSDLKNKQSYAQMLLEPVIVKLNGEEMATYNENAEIFKELGFDADVFGEDEIILRAAPQEVEWGDVNDLFVELLSQLIVSKKEIISQKLERMTYTIACKAAIKANYSMSLKEMESLVNSVFALENINTCPHGRPITVDITKKELEKMFKRIV